MVRDWEVTKDVPTSSVVRMSILILSNNLNLIRGKLVIVISHSQIYAVTVNGVGKSGQQSKCPLMKAVHWKKLWYSHPLKSYNSY